MRISDWSSDVCSSDLALIDEAANFAVRQGMFAGPQHLHGRTKRLHNRPAAFRVDVINMNAFEGRAVGNTCISLLRLVCLLHFLSQVWRISLLPLPAGTLPRGTSPPCRRVPAWLR